MVTNNSISGQSIGTSTNVGEGKFPQKITLNAATTAYVITPRLTNGAAAYDPAQVVRVWYTTSSFSLTAAQAVAQLDTTARYIDVRFKPLNGQVNIKDSTLENVTGGYLYLWCDVPNLATAATLDVNAVELP